MKKLLILLTLFALTCSAMNQDDTTHHDKPTNNMLSTCWKSEDMALYTYWSSKKYNVIKLTQIPYTFSSSYKEYQNHKLYMYSFVFDATQQNLHFIATIFAWTQCQPYGRIGSQQPHWFSINTSTGNYTHHQNTSCFALGGGIQPKKELYPDNTDTITDVIPSECIPKILAPIMSTNAPQPIDKSYSACFSPDGMHCFVFLKNGDIFKVTPQKSISLTPRLYDTHFKFRKVYDEK